MAAINSNESIYLFYLVVPFHLYNLTSSTSTRCRGVWSVFSLKQLDSETVQSTHRSTPMAQTGNLHQQSATLKQLLRLVSHYSGMKNHTLYAAKLELIFFIISHSKIFSNEFFENPKKQFCLKLNVKERCNSL